MQRKYYSLPLFFCLFYFIGIVVISTQSNWLPQKYFFDSNVIAQLIFDIKYYEHHDFQFFNSYRNTAYVYYLLGFEQLGTSWIVGFLIYSLSMLFVFLFLFDIKRWSVIPLALIFIWSIISSVYLNQYSKEFVSLFVSLSFISLIKNKHHILAVIIAMSYAAFFRSYWVIIIGFFLLHLFLIRKQWRIIPALFIHLFALVVISFIYYTYSAKFLSDSRFNINIYRLDDYKSSLSLILNIIANSSIFTDVVNILYALLNLLFPVYLFKLGGIQHIFFVFFQIANVYLFFKATLLFTSNADILNKVIGKEKLFYFHVLISWCTAYVSTQAIFEPDFGSFSRHLINIFPAIIVLIASFFNHKYIIQK